MKIKRKDFVEIEYEGRLKEDNTIFDTTDEKTAKEKDIHSPNMIYGPLTLCVGEGHVVKGLDDALVDKEAGAKFSVTIAAEDAFGKKDAKLLKIVNANVFRKQNINLMPGLQVTIDGQLAVIRTVTGGRVVVDFNHPLSGKDVVYDAKILRKVEDTKEKLTAYLRLTLGIKDFGCEYKDGKAEIEIPVPKEIAAELDKKIIGVIPEIKEIVYKEPKKKENKEKVKE